MKRIIKSASRGLLAAAVGAGALTVAAPLAAHGAQDLCVVKSSGTVFQRGSDVLCTDFGGPKTVAVSVGAGSDTEVDSFNAVAVSPRKGGATNAQGLNAPATSFNCTVLNTGGVCVNNQHVAK